MQKIIDTCFCLVLAVPLGLAFAVAGFAAGVIAALQTLRDVWRQ